MLLAAALALTAAAPAHASPLQRPLDQVVAAGAPGSVALVARDGRTATATSGVADLATGRPIRAGDRFRIGSTTKTFVATVVLQLAGERRLRLSDTVERWLPGALPYGGDVTIRQLLDHTGGVPDNIVTLMSELFHGDRFRTWTPRELVAIGAGLPRTTPGRWAYSNTDYALLGMIVERATGHSLRHAIEHRILRPLRLHDTSFPVRSPVIRGRHAHGYSLALDDRLRPIEGPLQDMTRFGPSLAWGSGNMISTAGDLARFQRALLGGRLLRPAQLSAMTSGVDTGHPGRRYGLGVFIRDTPCGTLIGNEGDIAGFSNIVMSSEDGTRTAVVMVNAKFAPAAVDDALDRAADAAEKEACG
jgi:D-alanyl-D-alanine carboxypeptidase